MSKEAGIRHLAHKIWLEEGSPDGETLVYRYGKAIKLKDIHWELAETIWIYGPDYFRSY